MTYKSTLNISELEQLAAERPENTIELFTPNDFYGHATILKKYCRLPSDFKLPGILPHGPRLSDRIWNLEITHPLEYLLLASKHDQEIYSRKCSKPSVLIGAPFYYAKRLIQNELKEIAKTAEGTIVFPLHSTHHITNEYNHSIFIKYLRDLPEKYHPIHICLYWRNIQFGHHLTYLDEGFNCTTAGHMYDKDFLPRLLRIFTSHKYFISNGFGTAPLYAAACGLPVTMFKQDYNRILETPNIAPKAKARPNIALEHKFRIALSDLNETAINDQNGAAKRILGHNHLLQPQELILLFEHIIESQRKRIPQLAKPETFEDQDRPQRFNVLQVNDHQNTGGAAKAGHRLFKGLLEDEVDINLVTFAPPVQVESKCLDWASYFRELDCKPSLELLKGQLSHEQKWYEIVSSVLENAKPDIVNLHNIHEAIHYHQVPIEVLELIASKAKLVLTLHDMWYLTGRCAYSADCNRFTEIACDKTCPSANEYPALDPSLIRKVIQTKSEIFSKHPDVVIVCPSRWLAGEVKSSFFGNHRVEVIPYGIDLDIFSPDPSRTSFRNKCGIKSDEFVLLSAAADLSDKRKGMHLLWDALQMIKSEVVIMLVGNGESIPALPDNVRVIHQGFVKDQSDMARLYSAADLFICPTLADNLPCVLIESISCGTPCIGFRSGGVPDVIRPDTTGWLADETSAESLAKLITSIISTPNSAAELRTSCRRIAESEYAINMQAKRYETLFRELIEISDKNNSAEKLSHTLSNRTFKQNSPEDHYNRIQPLISSGRPKEACRQLERFLESYPDFALAHNDLGVLLYHQGEKETAYYHYQQATQLDPENITFQKNMADFYYVERGQVEKALQIYVKILNTNPEDIETLLILGRISIDMEKFDDAKSFYNSVLSLEPGNTDARQSLEKLEKYQLSLVKGQLDQTNIDIDSNGYLVSAIVSTYNAERFIRGRLEDLENQTIADKLEIVVINSGSRQNEEEIIKEFQDKYSNIKYIKTNQRETVYAAWNRGIKASQGRYITNANTDDRLRQDAFEVMVSTLEAHPEIALVYADVIITETENENFEGCTPAGFFNWLNFDREHLLNKGCFVGPQPMWRREVHDEYGYFDPSFVTSGDYEFWLRISQTNTFMHLPIQLGLYLSSQGSIEHANRERQREENHKILNMYQRAQASGKIIGRLPGSTSKGHTETRSKKAESPESIYQGIKAEMENKQPGEVINALETLAESFPEFAPSYNDLGVLYYQAGEKEKAQQLYEKAVQLDPVNMVFQKNLADFYCVEMGRVEEALQIYVKILELNPQDIETLLITGHICVALHHYEDAKVFYRRVLELEPSNEDAQSNLNKLDKMNPVTPELKSPEELYQEIQPLLNNGDPHRAISLLEELLQTYPDFALAHNDLGVLYYHTGDKEKARHRYECAVDLMPDNINFQKNLADFLFVERGKVEEALQIYVNILVTHPDDVETLLITGHICVALKKFGDAIEFYERVLVLAPDNEDATKNLQALMDRQLERSPEKPDSLGDVSDPSAKNESTDLNTAESENQDAEYKTTASIVVGLDGIENRVKECLKSILEHTPEPHELLLVDRGATKGMLKWAQQLIKDKDNYHIIECARSAGWAESINQAIQKAGGEIMVLMHNDVAVPESWLEAFKMCIKLEPNIGVMGPMSNRAAGIQQMMHSDESDRLEFESAATVFHGQNQYRRVATRKLSDFCLAFCRDLPDKIGCFDEQFVSEEIAVEDFCNRAACKGYQNLIAADTYIFHYDRHKVKKNTSPKNSVGAEDRKKYNEKWAGDQNTDAKALQAVQLLARADLLDQSGRIDAAVEVLLGGIGVQPEEVRLYLVLSEMLLRAKRYQDAKEALSEMPLADDKQEMRKTELLAYAEEGLENFETSQALIEQVLSKNPDRVPLLNLKGILAYRNDDRYSAEKYFTQAIASDPGYGEPYTNLAMLQLEAKQPEAALELFEKGFTLSPTDLDIATHYHAYIEELADFERAENVARQASDLYPHNQKIKYMLIDFLVQQGKYEMAMPEIEDAIIKFGIDDGILGAALKLREKLGPMTVNKSSKRVPVSLCMIIKNEEKYLARCLASVKPIVDEMVVVDTGSTDRSRDIAMALGAQVHDYDWENDFAAARNFSISKAAGEWILILDGDEVISPLDYGRFNKIVEKKPKAPVAYSITTRNYNKLANIVGWVPNDGQYPDEEAAIGWLPSEKVRLFFGRDQIRFEGAVHELVDPVLKRNGIEIKRCSIPVHHYGRLDKEKLERKGEIYFDIGHKKLSEKGEDVNALRELAIQATILEKNQEAFELWQRLLALNPDPDLAAIAYVNLGTIYCRLEKFDDALVAAKRAVECAPDLKEAHYNLAMAELHCGNAQNTIRILESLLDGFPDYPPAQFILSAAYCCAGQKESGIDGIRKLKDTPLGGHLEIPCVELAQSLIAARRIEYALLALGAAIECDVVNKEILDLFTECIKMNDNAQKMSEIPASMLTDKPPIKFENLPQ